MAVAAETFEIARPEVYAKSLRSIRAMGILAVLDQVGTPEYISSEVEAISDFETALGENLATDSEFGKRLNFDRVRELGTIGGQTVDETGRLVRKIVKDGWQHSRVASETDKRMAVQAERDEGDLMVIGIVDQLEIGEMYAVLSFEPKQQLEQDPDFWANELGYRKGMAVAQVYYRLPNGKVFTGAYSIKGSSLEAGRQMLGEEGVAVPEDESSNRIIRYGIRKTVDEETARGFGKSLRTRHNQLVGNHESSISVTDFIEENKAEVKAYFDAYIKPLSVACATGDNSAALQTFAATIQMVIGSKLDSASRQHLIKITNSKTFDDEDGRFLENYIRYGLVEILRAKLPFNMGANQSVQAATHSSNTQLEMRVDYSSAEAMNAQMAAAMNSGVSAKRSYGGCSGTSVNNTEADLNNSLGAQDIFGGKLNKQDDPGKKENWVWKRGVCRIEECPTRPRETEIGPCDVCHCCQRWFDRGRDPAKIYGGISKVTKKVVVKSNSKTKQTKIRKLK